MNMVTQCSDTRRAVLNPSEIARQIVDFASEHQASDVLMLDIEKMSSFADYFVICTCQNARHLTVLAEELDTTLGHLGVQLRRQEGTPDSGWVLQDYGDVIVHLFVAEVRALYSLEQLWRGATPVLRVQ